MTYRAKVELLYLLGFSLDLVNMFIGNGGLPGRRGRPARLGAATGVDRQRLHARA